MSDNACGHAQASSGDHSRRRPGKSVPAQATTSMLGRERMRPGDDGCRVGGVFFHKHPKLQRSGNDVCVRATTSAPVRRRVPRGRGVFSQTPQTSALGRQRLRPGDNACVRATTPASGRRLLRPGDDVWILFFKRWHFFVLWQSKQNFSIISF